ncbi:hypothetical protein DFJ77DRAFT_466353 [Powellomyces hirtus]|nr:hypothetical protein DFJ77DRAFT_466353 [Powellomyces hirtus]
MCSVGAPLLLSVTNLALAIVKDAFSIARSSFTSHFNDNQGKRDLPVFLLTPHITLTLLPRLGLRVPCLSNVGTCRCAFLVFQKCSAGQDRGCRKLEV